MVVTFSWAKFLKKSKIYFKIVILIIILFYILPKLICLILYLHYPDPIIQDEHFIEKPLRVTATLLDMG